MVKTMENPYLLMDDLGVPPFKETPICRSINALPETNIASENRSSQKEFHLPTFDSQGRTVSFRDGKIVITQKVLRKNSRAGAQKCPNT